MRQNLNKSGQHGRPGEEAHHIVPGGHRSASEARAILKKFNIGVNSAENGVFLSGSRAGSIKDFFSLSHRGSGLHSNSSIRSVTEMLRNAKTRDQAVEVLNSVREAIKSGTLP